MIMINVSANLSEKKGDNAKPCNYGVNILQLHFWSRRLFSETFSCMPVYVQGLSCGFLP
jgi:hypothetical protein